ncbi:hypothetical protein H6S82_13460 [Planktothrix sp. FACHB-1355]|uniref:Uncharacterized protein n=1 Tax=Aerosakkonema funiforme FACHB-1375 TaxID=2949571 RepID=A0A926VCG4_9CYAN|nr:MULTISPECIES: hypothetical protein [Oscillatoriales]MBD2179999.1 hypothetical protein [Aerosakkonema funiforme FACHB-1375]MBD3559861.1 hypothetical protein [Planktothrix sp. FACHB-1355]
MNHKLERDESEAEDMLEEYDFSNAKPGRHRGFKGSLIRVLEDGTEQAITKNDRPNIERDRRQISLLLDAFIVEYFETKAGEEGVQELINQVLAEYIHSQY